MSSNELIKIVTERLKFEKLQLSESWKTQDSLTARTLVLDDLLPEDIVYSCSERLASERNWKTTADFRESKSVIQNVDKLGGGAVNIIELFHAPEVVRLLGEITQIDDLSCDPTLYAGGISRMVKGDFLNPHIDNSHDRSRSAYRRLNLLFYISPDLSEFDGGALQLWDREVLISRDVASQFNRLVVMETAKHTWHSVSTISGDVSRYCVSNYYFSNSSPDSTSYYHVTSFTGRPEQMFLRTLSRFDNFARQTLSRFLPGRGEKRGRNFNV